MQLNHLRKSVTDQQSANIGEKCILSAIKPKSSYSKNCRKKQLSLQINSHFRILSGNIFCNRLQKLTESIIIQSVRGYSKRCDQKLFL